MLNQDKGLERCQQLHNLLEGLRKSSKPQASTLSNRFDQAERGIQGAQNHRGTWVALVPNYERRSWFLKEAFVMTILSSSHNQQHPV